VYNGSSTSLVISWDNVTDDAVTSYLIKLAHSSGATSVVKVSAQKTEVEVGGLFRYSQYCVTVRATAEGKLGSESGQICASTAIDGKSKVRKNVEIKA